MSNKLKNITLIPVYGIAEVKADDDIAAKIHEALNTGDIDIEKGDVLVIAQKIVSKAEKRVVDLREVKPSAFAERLSSEISKDPRLVEVILGETRKVIKMDERVSGKGRLIVETVGGLISANAGVDTSNVSGGESVTLLPLDSDKSAREIRDGLKSASGKDIAVIISDTVGRPWRNGLVDIAIGCAGIEPLRDQRGEFDSKGLELTATEMATADQIACSAGMLMEKSEGIPVVIVRGYSYKVSEDGADSLIRDSKEDLFR